MASGSCTQWNPYNNPPAILTGEQDELANSQGLTKRLNAGNNKAPISSKALILSKASISSFILSTKDLFTKFIKAFVESIQAQD